MESLNAINRLDEGFIAQRMLENIAFFESYNKRIAQSLKNTLNGGNKRYNLLFNKNDINIIDIENKKFLYPKNSFINFALQIATNPLNSDIWKVYANNLKLAKIQTKNLHITSNAINEMVDLTHQININRAYGEFAKVSKTEEFSDLENLGDFKTLRDYKNPKDSTPTLEQPSYHLPALFLPQTNIFGLCGGLFLQILLEEGYKFHSLLIFEEDIELFAISCYFVDWARVFASTSPKSCYIFIEKILDKMFLSHYFRNKKITNNFLRLELNAFISPKIQHIKDIVSESYKANSRGWGSFEDEMIGVKNTLQNTTNHAILNTKIKLNVPICVVGSGPSLEERISFLRENQDKMLIFSCGTALRILRKHNINIDFQIEIERTDYLHQILLESNLDDTPLICASVVDSKVANLGKSLIFMRGGSSGGYMLKNILPVEFCAPFVGNAGVALGLHLSDEIILCGIDCGYIKGKTKHSSGSFYGSERAEIPPECFLVRGNADLEVYSNSLFSLSREILEMGIRFHKPKKIHNISKGAYIVGTNSQIPELGCVIDKVALKQKIYENALKYAPNNDNMEIIQDFCTRLRNLLDSSQSSGNYKDFSKGTKDSSKTQFHHSIFMGNPPSVIAKNEMAKQSLRQESPAVVESKETQKIATEQPLFSPPHSNEILNSQDFYKSPTNSIDSKEKLFLFIDEISAFLSQESFKSPHCGILFEGSVSHLAQNMLISLLSIHTNDIEKYCQSYINIIKKSLDLMLLEYSKL